MRFGNYAPKNFDEDYHGTVSDPRGAGAVAQHSRRQGAGRRRRPASSPAASAASASSRQFPDKTRTDARHGARRRRPDAARPRDALCRASPAAATPSRLTHRRDEPRVDTAKLLREGKRIAHPELLSPTRRLVRDRHPERRAAAAQRQERPLRLQDRHLLRLPRRLGHRLRRQVHHRRVGRPARRRRRRPGLVGRIAAAPILFDAFARLGETRAPLPKRAAPASCAPAAPSCRRRCKRFREGTRRGRRKGRSWSRACRSPSRPTAPRSRPSRTTPVLFKAERRRAAAHLAGRRRPDPVGPARAPGRVAAGTGRASSSCR